MDKLELQKLYKIYYKQKMTRSTLIQFSVGPSTFRAYSDLNPKKIFSIWHIKFTKSLIKKRKNISFPKLHKAACKSLENTWYNECSSTDKKKAKKFFKEKPHLIFKLVDLYFKHIPLLINEISKDLKKEIINNSNVPLDKYVYEYLLSKKKFPKNRDLFKNEFGVIPNSMGTKPKNGKKWLAMYNRTQEIIKDYIDEQYGGLPRISFDLLAWDNKNNNFL